MKIRSDFVTNSSSSSFVTVSFEYKDDTKESGETTIVNDEPKVPEIMLYHSKSEKTISDELKALNTVNELVSWLTEVYSSHVGVHYFESVNMRLTGGERISDLFSEISIEEEIVYEGGLGTESCNVTYDVEKGKVNVDKDFEPGDEYADEYYESYSEDEDF